ncbi:MAG: tetratricopeptide (TPR) repeat protein [Sulfurimonas sp.]|jgi:tetratricopeptide (TPR) repeat protein
MLDNGYVYVLMNPSMKDLVKIEKTTREPQERAKELSSTTGVPTPFIVVYDCYFKSCSEAECFVHTLLENKGFRVSSNREFFEIPIKDAIDSVMKAKEHFGEFQKIVLENSVDFKEDFDDNFNPDIDNQEIVEIISKATACYYGFGDEIQDYNEALKYYLKAIKLGSIESYYHVANMYENAEGVKEDAEKALNYLKEGSNKGCIDCYYGMAILFEKMENIDNARKSWKKYFDNVEILNEHIAIIYLKFALLHEECINYLDKMKSVKQEIIDIFKEDGPLSKIYKDGNYYSVGSDFIDILENEI